MPAFELCPCLDTLYPDVPVEHALAEVAAHGCRAIEFWEWPRRDLAALARAAAAADVRVAAFTGSGFDHPLVDADAHAATLLFLRRSLEAARALHTSMLVVHVGYTLPHRSRAEQWAAAVAGLRAAGDVAAAAGVTLLVEPLNSRVDHPGYFLDTLPDALRLLSEVNHPAVRLLLDVYHMRVMHADLLPRLAEAVPPAVHVHVADFPGRREPGSGEIPWPAAVATLRAAGYRGAIGLECFATGSAAAALVRSAAVLEAVPA